MSWQYTVDRVSSEAGSLFIHRNQYKYLQGYHLLWGLFASVLHSSCHLLYTTFHVLVTSHLRDHVGSREILSHFFSSAILHSAMRWTSEVVAPRETLVNVRREMASTPSETASWAYHSSPKLAEQFRGHNSRSAKKRRRQRSRLANVNGSSKAPTSSQTSHHDIVADGVCLESKPAKNEPKNKNEDECHVDSHNASSIRHSALSPQHVPIQGNTEDSMLQNKDVTETQSSNDHSFRFDFEMETSSLSVKEDEYNNKNGGFAFAFDVDNKATIPANSLKKKRRKKNGRRKKKKKNSNISGAGEPVVGGGCNMGSQCISESDHQDISNSPLEDVKHSTNTDIQNKESAVGDTLPGPSSSANKHTRPKSEAPPQSNLKDSTTKPLKVKPPPGFQFDPAVQYSKCALVNRQSMGLHKQNRDLLRKQESSTVGVVDDDTVSNNTETNPFTFGFSIFGDSLLSPG